MDRAGEKKPGDGAGSEKEESSGRQDVGALTGREGLLRVRTAVFQTLLSAQDSGE